MTGTALALALALSLRPCSAPMGPLASPCSPAGHSRIPVHRPGDRRAILGIMLVKELLLVDAAQGKTVGRQKVRSLPYVRAGEARAAGQLGGGHGGGVHATREPHCLCCNT
jgi:hypothetical protein